MSETWQEQCVAVIRMQCIHEQTCQRTNLINKTIINQSCQPDMKASVSLSGSWYLKHLSSCQDSLDLIVSGRTDICHVIDECSCPLLYK